MYMLYFRVFSYMSVILILGKTIFIFVASILNSPDSLSSLYMIYDYIIIIIEKYKNSEMYFYVIDYDIYLGDNNLLKDNYFFNESDSESGSEYAKQKHEIKKSDTTEIENNRGYIESDNDNESDT